MNITLEQARTLDAFAKAGTIQKTAASLDKAHTAVLYALKQLELELGLELFDRSGYRTEITTVGQSVLAQCRLLLDSERALYQTCALLQTGWEPGLKIIFDAIVPLGPLLEIIPLLRAANAPTTVQLSVDSLRGVEDRLEAEEAQAMICVIPPRFGRGTTTPLPPLSARLVAHRDHPLIRRGRSRNQAPWPLQALSAHVFLTVRGRHPELGLPTEKIDQQSTVHLSDFHAKKAAIMAGIGFGWLPDWLMESELKRRTLVPVEIAAPNVHVFQPVLVCRSQPGRALSRIVEHLAGHEKDADRRDT